MTAADGKVGFFYTRMVEGTRMVLKNLKYWFPEFADRTVCGTLPLSDLVTCRLQLAPLINDQNWNRAAANRSHGAGVRFRRLRVVPRLERRLQRAVHGRVRGQPRQSSGPARGGPAALRFPQ